VYYFYPFREQAMAHFLVVNNTIYYFYSVFKQSWVGFIGVGATIPKKLQIDYSSSRVYTLLDE